LDELYSKTKDPLNELNVILIYYAMDFSKSQKMYFLKNLVKHLKIIVIFLIYLITS
jgi:hypothetical protein